MKLRLCMGALVLVGVTALVTQQVISQEPGQKAKDMAKQAGDGAKDGPPGMQMDEETAKMMKKMEEMGALTEHHKKLNGMVGTWNVAMKWWMKPNQPPMDSTGVATRKLVLGNKFVSEDYSGEAMGQPFNGMCLTGFDNGKKKYITTWADSWGSSIMTSYGSMDSTGKVITWWGEWDDCMTGKPKKYKSITRIESDTKQIFEMYDTDADGKEFKTMEATYTKK